MSVFKTPEIREEVKKKWNEAEFIDVDYVGMGRNAPINKFVIEVKSCHYVVNVESWFYDSDCGDCGDYVDFYEIEDDFIEVVGISTMTIEWVEKKIDATE